MKKKKENKKMREEAVRYARQYGYSIYHCEVRKANDNGNLEVYSEIESAVFDEIICWAFDFLRTDATQHEIFPNGYTLEVFVEHGDIADTLYYISEV